MKRISELQLFVITSLISNIQCLLSLDKNLACAAGVSTILPIGSGLPQDRFPGTIPSGVNVCDASCGEPSKCTYNWTDSLETLPILLYKCQCPKTCPPPKMLYQGYLNIKCDDVTSKKGRCICPYGKTAFQCTLSILPIQTQNPFYCVCCDSQQNP